MLIGIGGHLAAPPLPHHRAYGSVPRRFDRVKRGQERRGGEDRDRRNTGCAAPVGRPDVRTCARSWSANRQQPVATENRIRAGADAAMGYPRFGMRDLLKLLGGLLVGLFRSHAAREAETAFSASSLSS